MRGYCRWSHRQRRSFTLSRPWGHHFGLHGPTCYCFDCCLILMATVEFHSFPPTTSFPPFVWYVVFVFNHFDIPATHGSPRLNTQSRIGPCTRLAIWLVHHDKDDTSMSSWAEVENTVTFLIKVNVSTTKPITLHKTTMLVNCRLTLMKLIYP